MRSGYIFPSDTLFKGLPGIYIHFWAALLHTSKKWPSILWSVCSPRENLNIRNWFSRKLFTCMAVQDEIWAYRKKSFCSAQFTPNFRSFGRYKGVYMYMERQSSINIDAFILLCFCIWKIRIYNYLPKSMYKKCEKWPKI